MADDKLAKVVEALRQARPDDLRRTADEQLNAAGVTFRRVAPTLFPDDPARRVGAPAMTPVGRPPMPDALVIEVSAIFDPTQPPEGSLDASEIDRERMLAEVDSVVGTSALVVVGCSEPDFMRRSPYADRMRTWLARVRARAKAGAVIVWSDGERVRQEIAGGGDGRHDR